MIEKILDLLFPKVCENCGKQGEGIICSSCFSNFESKIHLKKIYGKAYDYLIFLNKYEKNMRSKMLKFKFYDSPYLAEFFTELLLKSGKLSEVLKNFELIIPIPMFKDKKLIRGYNQTELLADNLSKKLNIKCEKNVLKRVKPGKTQSLLTKEERKENVRDVYKIENSLKITGKNVVLLDDIFTTGETVQNCSRLLKESGAGKICVLVVCKA